MSLIFSTLIVIVTYAAALVELLHRRTIAKSNVSNVCLADDKSTRYRNTSRILSFVTISLLLAIEFLPQINPLLSEYNMSKELVSAVLTALGLLFITNVFNNFRVYRKRTCATRIRKVRDFIGANHDPKFAFYFAHGDLNHPLHFLVWKKYLDELKVPYMLILREQKHLAYFMKDGKDVPTILSVSAANLKSLLPDTVTTVFYANNGFKNIEMINARPDLRHVQLLHGDSDKPSSYNPAVRCYTDLFVSGQMAVDRYTNHGVYIDPAKTHIVGRPQVSDIATVDNPEEKKTVTIAYMPTWFGYFEETQLSSLSIASSMIAKILDHDFGDVKVHLVFKAHPMSYKDPNSQKFLEDISDTINKAARNSAEVLDDTSDAISVFNISDILISDISSVVIDFLYSKKPYIITNTSNFDLQDVTKYPCIKGGYLLTPDADNIIEVITEAMHADNIKDQRLGLRHYAFGDADMKAGELFKTKSLEIINRNINND